MDPKGSNSSRKRHKWCVVRVWSLVSAGNGASYCGLKTTRQQRLVGARGADQDTARGQRTEVCAVELVAVRAKVGVLDGVEKKDICEGSTARAWKLRATEGS